jgi:hypothetical protein
MNKAEVIDRVRARLGKVGHGIDFSIIEDGVRGDESWWYVPVLAQRDGKDVPRDVTVNVFANIEDELQQEDGIDVLFIPAVA